MNTLDIVILLLFVPGIIRGLTKGFLEQGISLAGVVLAIWLAFRFCQQAGQLLQQYVTVSEKIVPVLGFSLVLVVTILAVILLGAAAAPALAASGGAEKKTAQPMPVPRVCCLP